MDLDTHVENILASSKLALNHPGQSLNLRAKKEN